MLINALNIYNLGGDRETILANHHALSQFPKLSTFIPPVVLDMRIFAGRNAARGGSRTG